jgi:hypothetical protein
MLAEEPSLFYIHEPFSVTDAPSRGICNAQFKYWFTYITRENENRFYRPLRNTVKLRYDLGGGLRSYRSREGLRELRREWKSFWLNRRKGSKALLKDPMAFFSAEWLAERFDMHVVMVIRHPAAFVSSIKKLGWQHPFSHFLDQPRLMRERLYPFARQLRDYMSNEHELLDQAILLWNMIHYTMSQYREAHKNWIFVRHEDLSRNPVEGFRKLYGRLDLEFSDEIQRVIETYSNSANPTETDAPVGSEEILMRNSASNIWNWKKRLTAVEIQKIRDEVEPIAREFYSAEDW